MRFIIFFLSTVLICAFSQSCRDKCNDPTNPKCKNYNPCLGKTAVSANFVFEVKVNDVWYPVEDVYHSNTVRFRCLQNLNEYKWLIGSETISDPNFVRTSFPVGQNIECTLYGKKTPDNRCFPSDPGLDTVTRFLKIWKDDDPVSYSTTADSVYYNPPPWVGTYVGYKESNPDEVYTVHFYSSWYNNGGVIYRNGQLSGLPYQGLPKAPEKFFICGSEAPCIMSISSIGTVGNDRLWGMHGVGLYDKQTGKIRIEFTHTDSVEYNKSKKVIDKKDVFIGTKK